MYSSDSEDFNCAESLSIPELFKLSRYSFRQSEYVTIQNILMEREKKMKIENETLVKDLGSAKEEVRLLGKLQDSSEKHKLKLEEDLQNVEMKCEEMKLTIARSIEEQKVANDKYNNLCKENTATTNESNKKIQCLERELEELKRQNVEYSGTIAELRLKEKELERMEQRILKMEKAIATIWKVPVQNLANLIHDADKVDTADKEGFEEGLLKGDGSNIVHTPPASPSGRDPSAETNSGEKNSGREVSKGLSNETRGLRSSGPHALDCDMGIERESPMSKAGGLPVIVIWDSDDETNNDSPANGRSASSKPPTRKRTGSKGEYLRNFLHKRKKNDTPLLKHVGLDSSDSDDASCSDIHMESLAAALKSRRKQ